MPLSYTRRQSSIRMKSTASKLWDTSVHWVGTHRLLLAICLVSLLVRLAFPLFLEPRASGIAAEHAMTALSIARGEGFHIDREWLEEIWDLQLEQKRLIDLQELKPPEQPSFTVPSTDYPPGYPLLMAITFKLFGQARYIYVQVLALIIDALVPPLLLYFLGSRLFHHIVGLVAASLYAVWLSFAYIAFEPRPEALLSSVSIALLATTFMFLRQGGWKWLALTASLIAIGVNLRSDMFSVVPFFALAVLLATKGPFRLKMVKGIAAGLVLAAVALVALVPYGFIQRDAFGRFAFATPALATNVWQGIGEYPNPWGAVMSDVKIEGLLATQGLGYATPRAEQYLWGKIRQAVNDDPMWFVRKTLDRAKRIISMEYNWGVPRVVKTALDVPGENVAANCSTWALLPGGSATCWGLALAYIATARFLILADWALWLGAILGVIIFRKRPYVWLLLVLPLARLIPFSFIHVEPRYILYGMGPVLIFLAALLVYGWQSRANMIAFARSAWPQHRRKVEG